jgi:uncharacterized protein (TIGR03083 family)
MGAIAVDRAEGVAAVAEAGARFVEMVRSLSADEMAIRVPWMEWTVGDVAAHLVTITRRMYTDPRRSQAPEETARLNALGLAEITERDPQKLADQIAEGLAVGLTRAWPKVADGVRVPFHAGTSVTIASAAGIVLGEFLIHGFDIAVTLGYPWALPRRQMALTLFGLSEVLYGWVAPAAAKEKEDFHIALAGESSPLIFSFAYGQFSATLDENYATRSSEDRIITVEPASFALTVVYKRLAATDPTLGRLSSLLLPA